MTLALLGAACAGPSARLPALPQDEIAAEKRKQEIAQLRDYYAQLNRLDTVAFRIRTANKTYCDDWVSAQIGLIAVTPQSLPRKFRSFSAEALDLRWVRPTVVSLVAGSPAEKAGIKVGDELMTFNNERVPVTGTAGWMDRFLKPNGEKPVQVTLRRDDTTDMTVSVEPVIGCAIPVQLEIDPTTNAYTNFTKIVIYSGMMRVTRTDAALATVVGHELAHVNMGHYEKRLQNVIVGTIGGAIVDGGVLLGGVSTNGVFTREFQKAGALAFSVDFEREADYVGAYYAVRAGYDLDGVEETWRRLGLENPDALRIATTHPITAARFIQMQKVAAEIAEKKRRNLPLEPELRAIRAAAHSPPPDNHD